MTLHLPAVIATLAAASSISLAAETEKAAPRSARFFPVGEAPPFRQEIRDGVRYELEPPPGSVPPHQVIPFGAGKEDAALELRLGRISAPVKAPSGEGPFPLMPAGARDGEKPWHVFQRPETGDFLVFLWRKPGPGGWSEVSHLIVPDGREGTPSGTVRIANLFPQTVRVLWGAEVIVLKAGAHVAKPIRAGAETAIQILANTGGGADKRYFSTTVTQNPGERGWIVLYRADGEAPRRPLKVLMIREPA